MGYVHEPAVKVVSFAEDHPFHGLTLRTRTATVGELTAAGQLATERDRTPADVAMAAADLKALFADKLISWNMQFRPVDGGDVVDVPPTVDGFTLLDEDFLMELIREWLTALYGVDDDLGKDSTPGDVTALEASLPMEPLSTPSQAS